jgi:hypothetical protein
MTVRCCSQGTARLVQLACNSDMGNGVAMCRTVSQRACRELGKCELGQVGEWPNPSCGANARKGVGIRLPPALLGCSCTPGEHDDRVGEEGYRAPWGFAGRTQATRRSSDQPLSMGIGRGPRFRVPPPTPGQSSFPLRSDCKAAPLVITLSSQRGVRAWMMPQRLRRSASSTRCLA